MMFVTMFESSIDWFQRAVCQKQPAAFIAVGGREKRVLKRGLTGAKVLGVQKCAERGVSDFGIGR